jgi:hypothetical protein
MLVQSSSWVYNWITLSLGDISTRTCSPRKGVGRRADDIGYAKINIVAKSREVKTRLNLAKFSKEGRFYNDDYFCI